MIATGPYWWYVNIGSVNGLVPSGNKQLSKPMSTRTEFNIAIWCHQDTFCGIMTPYNDIDLVQIGSGNEWLVVWRHQGCSALSHYLNKLKGRWFETSWRPCYVTVKQSYKTRFRYYKWINIQWESVEVCFVISQDMLLNKQSSDWWLETSWRSCGVTVITTPFRYDKWLCLQWESVEVSLVQVMACRLFGAKLLPEPVEGPVIWNVMTAKLRPCNSNAVITVITTRVVFIQIAKCADRRARTIGACGIRIRVLFEMLSLFCLF